MSREDFSFNLISDQDGISEQGGFFFSNSNKQAGQNKRTGENLK